MPRDVITPVTRNLDLGNGCTLYLGAPRFLIFAGATALLGALTHWVIMRPLRRASSLIRVIATLGVLRREGVPIPSFELPDAEMRCYRALEAEHGPLAHARYNALLREMVSFCNACHLFRQENAT